jgi:hypothetical protein
MRAYTPRGCSCCCTAAMPAPPDCKPAPGGMVVGRPTLSWEALLTATWPQHPACVHGHLACCHMSITRKGSCACPACACHCQTCTHVPANQERRAAFHLLPRMPRLSFQPPLSTHTHTHTWCAVLQLRVAFHAGLCHSNGSVSQHPPISLGTTLCSSPRQPLLRHSCVQMLLPAPGTHTHTHTHGLHLRTGSRALLRPAPLHREHCRHSLTASTPHP